MHLPLLLVQDSVLKSKTPWPNLRWIGEDGRKVCSASTHLAGEVDLSSGSCSKVAKLSPHTKTAAAINTTFGGMYVYGILSSGDLFFWHCVTGHVHQAKGIPEVVTHTTNQSGSNVVSNFFKQRLPQSLGGNVPSDGADPSACSVPSHHRPKIFASSSCSKVVVVLGASQVYLWERSVGTCLEDYPSSHNVPGSWSLAQCPSDTPLPSTHSKETQVTCCFVNEESSVGCHVTFSFVECSSVVVSTMTLVWQGSKGHPSAAHWNTQLVSLSDLGLKENELLHVKGTLISSYASGRSLLAIAVNSQRQHSKLLYVHPLCSTAVVTKIQDAVLQHRSSNENSGRWQWVSDLAWSHDSLYLFGCLASGALFVTTRIGPLAKISCQGEGLHLQVANILCLQPHSSRVGEAEGCESPGESLFTTFCVASHPAKHQVLLSSGLRVSVLSLPLDARKEDDVVDCLLTSATHALHLLCNSTVTHDYAYIRSSTWRLAHSVLDLTQGLTDSSTPNPPQEPESSIENTTGPTLPLQISLWDRRVVGAADSVPERPPGDEGELVLIEQVMNPLMAAWVLVGSHSGPHTVEWRRRGGEVVVLAMRLLSTLLRVTADDDHFEHQTQLLLVLHFYHQFVRVLCVWPNSLHMLRPTLQLTHRLLHTVLACEKHAGERSMASTLLILAQTLTSVQLSLTQTFALRPALPLHAQTMPETVQVFPGIEVTNLPVLSCTANKSSQLEDDYTISLRMKKLWLCIHENAMKVYTQLGKKKFDRESYQKSVLVLNIVQSKLQNVGCDLHQGTVRLRRCRRFYLDGLYLKAIQVWKCEIMRYLAMGQGKKTVAQNLHSILYAYLLHEGFSGVTDFVDWLSGLLRFLLCPKKQSSQDNSVKKTITKTSGIIRLSPESSKVNQSPKTDSGNKGTVKDESQETQVPVMRKLFQEGIHSKNRIYTYSSLERESSQECTMKPKTLSWMIRATRQVIGSLGRILALETLGCCPGVPAPHKPHAIPPLWISTTQPQGIDGQLSPIRREEAGSPEQWSVDATAQALAIAGCWGDLAVLASRLRDTRVALMAGVLASVSDSRVLVPSTVLPLYQITHLLLDPVTTSTSSEFQSYRDLLQLAAMTGMEVVPGILEECLTRMRDLTPLFETFVPSQVHLPAPPVFCPLGPQDGEELSLFIGSDSSPNERRLRQEVAGWLRLACQVTSAAGIAYPLLLSLQQEYSKLPLMGAEDLSCLVESLGPLEEHWHPVGPEWEVIIQLWHKVIALVWVLYSRDKLSLRIRSLVRNSAAVRQDQKLCEMCILEILSWVDELNTLCDHDSWRTDLLSCAVAAASEAPPVLPMAAALAKVLSHPSEISSLLRDKTERLFVTWKNTVIAVNEVEPSLKKKLDKKEVNSSPEIFKSLFSIYEETCEEIARHLLSEGSTRESCSNVSKYPTESSNGTSAAAAVREEFGKFLTLFVELTFLRDVQKFPQLTSQVPLLVQFSDVLRKREFEGMKLKSKMHHGFNAGICNSVKQSPCRSSYVNTLTTPEKKGLFRSLDYTRMLPRGNETVLLSPVKSFATSSPKGTLSVEKYLYNFGKENAVKSGSQNMPNLSWRKFPSPSIQRRSRSLSRKKSRPASVSRARSLSVGSGLRVAQKESAKQHSVPSGLKVSQSIRCGNKESPMQKLMCFPEYFPYNIGKLESQGTVKLLNWMMSRERQFCPHAVESDALVSGVSSNIKLTFDDLMFSVRWNDLFKCWLHMKDKKSFLEVTAQEFKKKEKGEQKISKGTDSFPLNELVVSGYENVNTEVDQGKIKSTETNPEKEPQINIPNVFSAPYIPEEPNDSEEQDEQSHHEPDTEGMKNLQLSANQDAVARHKENVQIDDEYEKPLLLPSRIPDTRPKSSSVILSDILNIQSPNKGSVMDSKFVEGHSMEGCSKESSVTTYTHPADLDQHDSPPATHVTYPSQTIMKETEYTEISPVYSIVVEGQEEDEMNDMKSGKNNRVCIDLGSSHNEDPGGDTDNGQAPLKPSYKNTTKAHQVKVHAKEVKQSVPSRQSIQVHVPCRGSNLTGVEAPEALSDPDSIPFGHLLHLPPEAAQGSKSRLAELQDQKNATSSKPDRKTTEDTLDDVTLPDSLHASDLEEESELEVSGQNIQDVTEGSKCEPIHDKSEEGDAGMGAPLQNICGSTVKENKYEPLGGKPKRRQARLSASLHAKKTKTCDFSCYWDYGELHLRPLAVQVKPARRTAPVDEVDEICTSRDEKNMAHSHESHSIKKTLKLLTLPKSSQSEKWDTKQEKSLQLKQFLVHEHRHTATDKLNRNQNGILNAPVHCKGKRVEEMRPLTIPKYFYSHPKEDGKTNTFSFLNPHQVFAFCKYSALKSPSGKFKTLKVSKKHMIPDSEWQNETRFPTDTERKEQGTSDQVRESLDKGFLDQVKNYAKKYKKGNYENILRGGNQASKRGSILHYEPSEAAARADIAIQNQPQPSGKSRFVKFDQNSIHVNNATNIDSENLKNNMHSNCSSDINLVKQRKVENKSINTEPHEVMLKTVKTQGTQMSNTETQLLDGNRLSQPSPGSVVQTQTYIPQTKEASVLAEVIVLSKSKSVQVDSLPPPGKSPPLPSPLPQVNQSSPLAPNAAFLPQHPSSYKLGFQAPSHHLQAPSDTGTEFVHIFDTPNEIVKEELKGIEMNKTIHSLDVHESDEDVDSGSLNVCEERKSEKSLGHAKGKDDRKAGSLHEKQVLQTLHETGRSDRKELERSGYSSQKFVNDQLNSVPYVSLVPNKICRNDNNMTIDKLYEEFCSGKISLEDFYQASINIPKEEEVKEDSLPKTSKKSIQALEQQALEAAQSISESQHLMSRVRLLMEGTEMPETDTYTAQSHRSCEKFSTQFSHKCHNDVNMAGNSREKLPWQEALSVYRKQGKIDSLIQFLNAVDFENITSDMIDEIIECENNIQSKEVQKTSGHMETGDNTSLHQKRINNRIFAVNKKQPIVRGAGCFSNKDTNYQDPVQKETHSAACSEQMRTEEWQKSFLSGTELSELHLNLACIRSLSDDFDLSSTGSLLGESTASVGKKEKLQQRRSEIQAWIKRQRQKRREEAQARLSAPQSKSQLMASKTLAASRGCSRVDVEAVSDVAAENIGLTGKQIRERSWEREVKRAKQRENHQKKREADIAKLLDDHEEELATYRSFIEPSFLHEFPPTSRRCTKLKNSTCSSSKNSHLGSRSHINLHARSKHGVNSKKKPGLNKYFKDKTEEWRKRQQQGLIQSSLTVDQPEERGKECVVENRVESSTSLQMELYYLKRCLHPQKKEKLAIDLKSRCKPAPLGQSYYPSLLPKDTSKIEYSHHNHLVSLASKGSEITNSRECSSRHSLQLSGTFTLPLDRISEVASSVSETSLSDSPREAKEVVPAGEDSSTDTSWTVPQEVKNLLYSNP